VCGNYVLRFGKGNLKERGRLEELGVEGMIILKYVFKK
jgi:hypothetical protein